MSWFCWLRSCTIYIYIYIYIYIFRERQTQTQRERERERERKVVIYLEAWIGRIFYLVNQGYRIFDMYFLWDWEECFPNPECKKRKGGRISSWRSPRSPNLFFFSRHFYVPRIGFDFQRKFTSEIYIPTPTHGTDVLYSVWAKKKEKTEGLWSWDELITEQT